MKVSICPYFVEGELEAGGFRWVEPVVDVVFSVVEEVSPALSDVSIRVSPGATMGCTSFVAFTLALSISVLCDRFAFCANGSSIPL